MYPFYFIRLSLNLKLFYITFCQMPDDESITLPLLPPGSWICHCPVLIRRCRPPRLQRAQRIRLLLRSALPPPPPHGLPRAVGLRRQPEEPSEKLV